MVRGAQEWGWDWPNLGPVWGADFQLGSPAAGTWGGRGRVGDGQTTAGNRTWPGEEHLGQAGGAQVSWFPVEAQYS